MGDGCRVAPRAAAWRLSRSDVSGRARRRDHAGTRRVVEAHRRPRVVSRRRDSLPAAGQCRWVSRTCHPVVTYITPRTGEHMKIAIGMRVHRGPWGGGNQFAAALERHLIKRGVVVTHDLRDTDVDIVLLT